VLSDLHNGGERLGGANEVSGGGAPCTCPRLLGERVPMPIRFERMQCKQCGARVDVREMCEVQTWYSKQTAAFWDRMCRVCAAAYCDFMHRAHPSQESGVEILIHPL